MCRVDDKGERCSKVVSRRQNDVSFFSKFFSSTKKRIWMLEKSREKFKKKGPVCVSLMYNVKRKYVVIKLYCLCCFVKRKKMCVKSSVQIKREMVV